MKKKAFTVTVFSVYCLLLIWLVVFKLTLPGDELSSYRSVILIPFSRPDPVSLSFELEEMVMNVIVFIPLGLYLSVLNMPKKIWARVLTGFAVSLIFESVQYIFEIGTTDITDLINNTVGTIIGVLLCYGLRKLLKEKTEPVINITLLGLCAAAVSGYAFLRLVN